MRKRLMMALATAALVAAMLPGVAAAGSATPFKAEYPTVAGLGYWECTGAHIENRNVTKDDQDCLVTGATNLGPGTYSGDPWGYLGAVYTPWRSDYYEGFVLATSWSAVVTDNGDGTLTVHMLSYYS